MKHKDTVKYSRLSSSLINRLRRIPGYTGWRKQDFINNYCRNNNINHPRKKDHASRWNILCRFATEHGIGIPTIEGIDSRRPSKVKSVVPNLKYDGTHGFTKWRKIRYDALKRSKGHCECCGATPKSSGEPLHVDHIKPKSIYPELEFKLSNLQVLCADCNIGKGNWDETNWLDINKERKAEENLDVEQLSNIVIFKP